MERVEFINKANEQILAAEAHLANLKATMAKVANMLGVMGESKCDGTNDDGTCGGKCNCWECKAWRASFYGKDAK